MRSYFLAVIPKKEKQWILQLILKEINSYCLHHKGATMADEKDYYCQMLRIALKINQNKLVAIEKIGKLINFAKENNDEELIRACHLYLEEAGIVFNERRRLKRDD